MPEGVAEAMPLIVKGLGGEHMPVALGHKIGLIFLRGDGAFYLETCVVPAVGKVVEGVYVLEQTAFFKIPHAARLTAAVNAAGGFVGEAVKLVAVLRLVYPNAPEHDRRVMHILPHHLFCVDDGLLFPSLVADMLPAGYLGEHQDSELIAAVDKML